MKVLDNGDRVLSPEEWNTHIKPALKNNLILKQVLREIKPDNTGKTDFNENSNIAKSPVKEMS